MKTIPVLTSLFLLIASATLPAAEAVRHVTVDGKGLVSAVPDMAEVSMSVEDRNLDIDAAKRRVNDVSADFLALCRKLGIDESRVRSTGLSVYPEYRWNDDRKEQELLAYRVNRQLEVELADLDDLAELMEGAVAAGVNNVSPPRLKSSRERRCEAGIRERRDPLRGECYRKIRAAPEISENWLPRMDAAKDSAI